MNNNFYQNTNINNQFAQLPQQVNHPQKNRERLYIILAIVIVIFITCIFLIYLFSNSKKEKQEAEPKIDATFANYKQGVLIGKVDPNTNLTYDEKGAFLMYVEDTFIRENQVFANGRILRGTIKEGDVVQIIGVEDKIFTSKVTQVVKSYSDSKTAKIGENVALVVENAPSELKIGPAIIKPNSMVATTSFQAQIHVLKKEEGGARHDPFYTGYHPQFYFAVSDTVGTVELPEGMENASPGDDLFIAVQLESPVAMEVGMKFYIRENGMRIAEGKVVKVN